MPNHIHFRVIAAARVFRARCGSSARLPSLHTGRRHGTVAAVLPVTIRPCNRRRRRLHRSTAIRTGVALPSLTTMAGPTPHATRKPPPQYGAPAAVPASYAASYGDNRAVAPAAEWTYQNPQAAAYATEIVRPLPPVNEYPNSPDNAFAWHKTPMRRKSFGRGAAPAGEQPAASQTEPAPENRFLNLLPAAGPPPLVGPAPTPESVREYQGASLRARSFPTTQCGSSSAGRRCW